MAKMRMLSFLCVLAMLSKSSWLSASSSLPIASMAAFLTSSLLSWFFSKIRSNRSAFFHMPTNCNTFISTASFSLESNFLSCAEVCCGASPLSFAALCSSSRSFNWLSVSVELMASWYILLKSALVPYLANFSRTISRYLSGTLLSLYNLASKEVDFGSLTVLRANMVLSLLPK